MNRRVSLCVGLMVLSGLWSSSAFAQTAPAAATLSPTIKAAANADSFAAQIQQYVQDQVNRVAGDDAVVQRAAREKLIADCSPGSTQSFFENYGRAVNASVHSLLAKNPPLQVRLNLAVLVEAVARVGQTATLEPVVIDLLNDPTDCIALWGMKAARHVVVIVLQNPAMLATDKLIPAIAPAVKSHKDFGYIANEAYRALIPEVPGMNPTQFQQMIPPVLGPLLNVLEFRTSIYLTGIPDSPDAERDLPTFLSKHYPGAKPAEQKRIVQDLDNLVSMIGQQAPFASRPVLEAMTQTLKYAAGALIVIANDEQMTNSIKGLTELPPGVTGFQVNQRTKGVFGILQVKFAYLTPPPTVTPAAAPTSAPAATAPATGASGIPSP